MSTHHTSDTSAGGAGSGRTRLADRIPKAPDNVRELFSRRPTMGPGPAAQAVVTDISDLVKAEVALAKAELTEKATRKGLGIGLLLGAGVAGWLALQGLLVTAGFLLALVLPAWAAALIVTAVLLVVAAVLGLLGKRRFATPLGLETTKASVSTDVDVAKSHLQGPPRTPGDGVAAASARTTTRTTERS